MGNIFNKSNIKKVLIILVIIGIAFVGIKTFKDRSNKDKEVVYNNEVLPFIGKTEKVGEGNNQYLIPVKGKLYSTEGALIYEGGFKEGKLHGRGKIIQGGKLVYDGEFENDLKHGYGKEYIYEEHTDKKILKYEGYFEKGEHHGLGHLFRDNGSIEYEGHFNKGVFHGVGRYYNTDGTIRFDGMFTNGVTESKNITLDKTIRFVKNTQNFAIHAEYAYEDYKPYMIFLEGVYNEIDKIIPLKHISPIKTYFLSSSTMLRTEMERLGRPESEDRHMVSKMGKEIFVMGATKNYFPMYLIELGLVSNDIDKFGVEVLKAYYETAIGYSNEDGSEVTLHFGMTNNNRIRKGYEEVPLYSLESMLEGNITTDVAHCFAHYLHESGVIEEYSKMTMDKEYSQREILERLFSKDIESIDGDFIQFMQTQRTMFHPVVKPTIYKTKQEFDEYMQFIEKMKAEHTVTMYD